MTYIIRPPYSLPDEVPNEICLNDHLGGFDHDFNNEILDHINKLAVKRDRPVICFYHSPIESSLKQRYPMIDFKVRLDNVGIELFNSFNTYNIHPTTNSRHFLCSFNGTSHPSRKLLVSALHQHRFFNSKTCSKNFKFTSDALDGHLADYLTTDKHRFYRKFFISDHSADFFSQIYTFGHVQYDHANNIYNLEHKLTSSFLHLVSETMATSYYPFVTEKFLYSVVTRGLFLAYAQPGWHDHLERYYGFRKYDKIFDYRFDSIHNPVERLVELMSMISKFSVLSSDDWRDLYEIEKDTIEYNYDHYFSKNYLKLWA